MDQSHHHLIHRCRENDTRAQMELYDLYCDAMFIIASRYLNDSEEAKDVIQESFLKAFTNLENFDEKVTFGAWLKRIVINRCLDQLRKIKPMVIEMNQLSENIDEIDAWDCDYRITKPDIIHHIKNLKETYQIILKLFLLEGYDHEEISQILSIPNATSRTQLHRAKKALQTSLKSYLHEKGYTRYS